MSEATRVVLHPEVRLHRVSNEIYSHFAEHLGRCIYGGIWVGPDSSVENDGGFRCDTVEALKKLALPVLRWPGGCFADNYHWMDGIGPRENRPRRYNLWWKQPETNEFGTDEFMQLCQLIGSEPYICLNVGSGTVEEALGWVEYCNSDQDTSLTEMRRSNGHVAPHTVRYWGIGNEVWGCGGRMRPAHYADLYRRFANFVRKATGPQARLIACGSHPRIPDWDESFLEAMKGALHLVDYVALHIYSGWGTPDVDFADADYYSLIAAIDVMDENLSRACGLARAYSTAAHRIGVVLDEWGTWFREATVANGLYQQNTMRDALFAAASFHAFHRHADWLFMTNMSQTTNVLQALLLTTGPQMVITPTYHVYDMFRPHRDGHLVPLQMEGGPSLELAEGKEREAISASATVSEDGDELFLSVVNLGLQRASTTRLLTSPAGGWKVAQIRRLGCPDVHAHNTFEAPRNVWPEDVTCGAADSLDLPARSITTVRLVREQACGAGATTPESGAIIDREIDNQQGGARWS